MQEMSEWLSAGKKIESLSQGVKGSDHSYCQDTHEICIGPVRFTKTVNKDALL